MRGGIRPRSSTKRRKQFMTCIGPGLQLTQKKDKDGRKGESSSSIPKFLVVLPPIGWCSHRGGRQFQYIKVTFSIRNSIRYSAIYLLTYQLLLNAVSIFDVKALSLRNFCELTPCWKLSNTDIWCNEIDVRLKRTPCSQNRNGLKIKCIASPRVSSVHLSFCFNCRLL